MFWKKWFGKKNGTAMATATVKQMSFKINATVLSDMGNIRTNNEDNAGFLRSMADDDGQDTGCLLIVADGMGGHLAGEVASKIAVETISAEFSKFAAGNNAEKMLANAFIMANQRIFQMSGSGSEYRGMGTTCTAVLLQDDKIYYAHAGDSRAYLLKKERLHRITQDHTYVQELVNNGEITAEEAETHDKRNVLTNAMGTKASMRVDTGKMNLPFEEGDRVMLCSDGLYDYIKDAEISKILGSMPISEAASYMISEAKRRGGHDNITVVMAEKKSALAEQMVKQTQDLEIPGLSVTQEHDLP